MLVFVCLCLVFDCCICRFGYLLLFTCCFRWLCLCLITVVGVLLIVCLIKVYCNSVACRLYFVIVGLLSAVLVL